MEDNKEDLEKKETAEGNEEAGKVDTQATENKDEGSSNVDVKAEAQKIADAMLAKKMKGMPTKEELKAFKDWQESQKTAEQKQAEKETEYQNALSKNTSLMQENTVLRKGVNADDVDYVVFKVSKMEGEFEENLDKFLKDNPKYLGEKTEEQKATGTPVKTFSSNSNDGVLGILASKHPDIKF